MPKMRRARCEAVAETLDLPRPFDLGVLCDRIAARRGRPLRLIPLEGNPDVSLPCGVWVATGTADLIFYEPATSALHKLQIVLHEVAHMLLGHGAPDAQRPAYTTRLLDGLPGGPAAGRGDGPSDSGSGGLGLPGGLDGFDEDDELDLDQLCHVLGRTSYSDDEEKDAELLATILSDRALAREAPAVTERAAGLLDRLNDAFGHPLRGNP